MRRAFIAILVAGVVAACFFAAPVSVRAQSRALVNTLAQIQQLSDSDFGSLAGWAQNGAPAPFTTFTSLDQTKTAILSLGDKDRQAILLWLQGSGRSALYARGASDYQIGSPRAPADQANTPTPSPNPWREVPLASMSLEGGVQGQIQIVSGFAGVKRDGTGAIACISFRNLNSLTARRVIVQFPLLDRQGNSLGALTLDRNGEFSSNVLIATWDGFSTWLSGGIGPRGYDDNCIKQTLAVPAVPLLRVQTASYQVMRVEYSDGSFWTPSP
jgi:hypothetical protein